MFRVLTLLVCLAVFLPSAAFSQDKKDDKIVVTIDNPNFRKLVMAIPLFQADANDVALSQQAKDGSEELKKLMLFTGFFNIMSEDAYKGIKLGNSTFVNKANPTEIGGINIKQWKGIGVEALTVGKLTREQAGLILEIMTIDINKGTVILGKRFTRITDIKVVLRRYADLLLQAYTGKPGIFSSKIAFIGRKRKGAFKQVFISDIDGSNLIQITNDNTIHLSPNWSPDGKKLVYTSFKSGNPDLYMYDLTNGKVRKLSGYKGMNSGGSFTPDGKKVVFTGAQAGDTDIYMVGPSGGRRVPLIRGHGLDVDPTFSPDGKYIAFVSGRFGNPHIFRGDLSQDGGKYKVVKDKRLTYAGWYNATPAWSPESDKIAFAGYDKEIDRFDIFMMNPDGTSLERLTIRAGDNESPSWSPNGQMIIFQSNRMGTKNIKGRPHLWIMNRDGSGQRKLNINLYEAQTPKWGPQIGY